jgi:plastocyanin
VNNKSFLIASGVFVFIVLTGVGVYINSRNGAVLSDENTPILSGEVQVKMGEDQYTPSDIKIRAGTKVTFINNTDTLRWPASDLHPSHGLYPEFDPKGPIKQGEEWSFTFNDVGEWGYHDHLAPYITGIVEVID